MTGPAQRALGAFPVVASPDEVDAFRAATRCAGHAGFLPLTFPMRWLMRPDIRRALMAMLPEDDLIPVHESQSFEYVRPLEVDVDYTLEVSGHRAAEPDRLFVTAEVRAADGGRLAQLDTILRLVSTTVAA